MVSWTINSGQDNPSLFPSSKESTLTFSRKDVVCNRSTSRGDVPGRNPSGDQRPREHLLQLSFQTRGTGVGPFSFVFGWSTFIFGSADAGQVGSIETGVRRLPHYIRVKFYFHRFRSFS